MSDQERTTLQQRLEAATENLAAMEVTTPDDPSKTKTYPHPDLWPTILKEVYDVAKDVEEIELITILKELSPLLIARINLAAKRRWHLEDKHPVFSTAIDARLDEALQDIPRNQVLFRIISASFIVFLGLSEEQKTAIGLSSSKEPHLPKPLER